MERPETASERRRRKAYRWFDFGSRRCAGAKRLQGIRSNPRPTCGDGSSHQGFQGRHHLGDCAMNPSEIGVIAGLDPAIHQLKNSSAVVWVDARVEPAQDGRGGWQPMRNLYLDEIA